MSFSKFSIGKHWPKNCDQLRPTWQFDRSWEYKQNAFGLGKPRGLWTSPAHSRNDWEAWVYRNESQLLSIWHWEIIMDLSNAITLRTPRDIPAQYRLASMYFEETEGSSLSELLDGDWGVDWEAMQADGCTGIHVPEYKRGDSSPMWWRFIDCDSTVLWDLSAVVDVTGPHALRPLQPMFNG